MEKRNITGKDILRMDGLLPPTRRLPVCDAVTSSDKKKEKKWSIGGILKRISSIRDYESSSNEEEMVYCTRQSRPLSMSSQKSHNVTLHPVKKDMDQRLNKYSSSNGTIDNTVDTASLHRDSTHFRSSDGSLDRANKKLRRSVLKAKIEAKRDRICADSSSDEDSRVSCNSLNRFQNESTTQNVQKSSSCNRKSRAARTERYVKRLSKDESYRFSEQSNNTTNKRNTLDFTDANPSLNIGESDLLYSQVQSRSTAQPNSYTFPVQRSVENVRQAASCSYQTKSSTELARYPSNRYITDLNQNNTYTKPNVLYTDKHYTNQEEPSYFSTSTSRNCDYAKPCDYIRNNQTVHQSSSPPEPPPRDPRCKVFTYGCNSFPSSGKYRIPRYTEPLHETANNLHGTTRDHLKGIRSYDSNNEISWCGSTKQCPRRPLSLAVIPMQSCNSSECTNNKHNSTGNHVNEPKYHETEAMKCQRRNNRNEQLNLRFNNRNVQKCEQKYSPMSAPTIYNSTFPNNKTLNSPNAKSPIERNVQDHRSNDTFVLNTKPEKMEDKQATVTQQDVLDRRRSSKNLEEALSELEAIYNSLCLGDEDLLDRAERRSMEEFTLRRGKADSNVALDVVDSPDRSKDDMAYRRMHPKERPASLSEVIGQSALSNISYLMASPVLSRKDTADDYPYAANYPVRKDEPDVTRDDVVYRNIHHANNTLKVVDPQPLFGIPLGPVTTATESDYLHTTPTKPEQPRSLYIPQCEPDIVTDDLAYRTLRKDASTAKNEGKSSLLKDQETTYGIKKKRAVRSLSANLYGLINHDRIHLRREPSLQELKVGVSDAVIDVKSLPARSDCFRRVVSDGELSDYDTRWRAEASLKAKRTDVNGNHPFSNINRRKLRVYVSPSTMVQNFDKKGESNVGAAAHNSVASNGILSQALSTDFWQDRLQAKSNDSSNQDTESDFTAYSNLCQDLVNLIEGEENADAQLSKERTPDTESEQPTKVDKPGDSGEVDDTLLSHIQTLGSQHSRHGEASHKEIRDNEDVERLTESIGDSKNEDPEKTDDNAFDFYLRVADENVKLIAEAFSSVADRLRDSRLSQKNLLTSPQRSEIENDSTAPNTSTRSSLTYSPDNVNDDLSSSSKSTDVVPKETTSVSIIDWEHEEVESDDTKNNSGIDPELDLSKAIHDLQIAAASLCEHEKEIEELEALWKKDTSDALLPCVAPIAVAEEEPLLAIEKSCIVENDDDRKLECDEEKTVLSTDVMLRTEDDDPDDEGESTECENICGPYKIIRSTGMRISYVTNLVNVMITTYSMVLLACFLALLLASIAAAS